ncbi:hnhc [Caudoviricetes sp.]|nr:hnhc [Caudoviricetes sp.]UOF81484.1 hnhc [Caudoviricetes sp.]
MIDVSTTKREKLSPTKRLKLFERHKGLCGICGKEIRSGEKWISEHLRPLSLGGTNDASNLAPAHLACAEAKTLGPNGDLATAAKAKRAKMAALGIKRETGKKIQSRGFDRVEKAGKIDKDALPQLPRRSLYQ